ncbi:DUF3558 family protein [Rhodococcus sp. NPDC058521]|uniref:DUF3558 domain-containing protein n=1 Tax=Rhodococcus sp. NPDC058521 TaxID=3346536 RepID=UPI0036591AE7
MRRSTRINGATVATLALAVSLAACGTSDDDAAEAQPQPRLTAHPCDVFGPDARASAGIDKREPERYQDREEPYQRRSCSYMSSDPYSSVLVSFNGFPISDVDDDDRFTRTQEAEIVGRRTVVDDFPGGLQCLASVDFDPGVLEVMVGYEQSDIDTSEQACPLALKVAQDLAPYFPEHL